MNIKGLTNLRNQATRTLVTVIAMLVMIAIPTQAALASSAGSISAGTQTGTLTYGIAGSATYTVTVTCTGGGGGFTTNLSVSGLTTGASGVFSPTSLTWTNNCGGGASKTSTLTVSTLATAQAGATSFTVTESNNSHTGTGTLTIGKATPTLSVTNSPVTYDAAAHAATVSGSVPGSVTNILTGGAATKTNAGTYAVTANFAPTDTANYNSLTSAAAGNFIINKATPTLSVTNSPVTYDGAAHGAAVSASIPGSVTNILTGGAATKTNAGTYAVTANFTPTDTANYNSMTGAAAGNFIINSAGSTTVVTCPVSAVYTGLALTPCTVAVTGAGGLSLTPAPVYASNTNVGTASASYTFTGDANHTGSTDSKNFDITPAGSTTVVTCPVSAVYTGLALTPCTVAVTGAGGLSLTPAPVYASNTDVGTASASYTFTGDANHTGSTDSKNFDITPAGSTTVVTCPVSAVYTGLALTPCTVAVTGAGGLSLTPAPVYASNTDVGTASASYTFTGDANHTGSTDSKNFDITKAGSTTVVTCPVSAVYTGLALTPCTVAVTGAGGLSLTPDAVYASNTNVGTASASYTFTGDANHTGSTDSKNFDITPAGSTTVVTCPVSAVYTGLALTPCTVAVTGAGGLSLTPAPVYASNTDVGTASASYTFTGDANHTGSTDSKNFDITKAGSTTVVTCPVSAVYTGLALTPCTVAVTGAGGLSLTPDAVYASNTNVGTASASYTFTGDANHTGSTDSKNFDITPAGSTTVVTCPVSAVYTGLALTPCTVAVTGAGGLSLTPDAVYASNTDVGTASASYTFTGDANHTGSTDSKNFDITKAGSTTVVTCPVSAVYTGLALTPCTVAVTGAGGLSLTPDAVYASNTNVGTASASYTFTGDANHTGSTDSKNFDITKASSTTTVTGGTFTYDGLVHPATVAVTGVGGLSLTPAPDYSGSCSAAPITVAEGTSCTAGYTYAGDPNHNGSNSSDTITVNAKAATVTANDLGKAYGDDNPTLTAAVVGEVTGGDAINYTLSTTAVKLSPVGPFPITVALGANPNYTVTPTDGTLTVNAKTINVTADAKSKLVGAVDPELTYTNDPLVGANTFTGALARDPGETPGTYAITQGTLLLGSNYDLVFHGALLTITATDNAPVITEGASNSVGMNVNGKPKAFSLTLHATDIDVADTLTWSISTPATHGTASASATGSSKAIGYTPTHNYFGPDSFVVQVSDGTLTDTITVNVTVTRPTLTFKSVAALDGRVLESGENTNLGGSLNAIQLIVGDDKFNDQYRGILSFNTAGLPDNAVVTQITLRIKSAGVTGVGNPFATLGNILVDVRKGNFGLAALQITDFQALPTRSGAFTIKNNPLAGGWYFGSLGTPANALINKTGNTQMRLRFTKDDNNNHLANYFTFFSGNAPAASQPILLIQYYVP